MKTEVTYRINSIQHSRRMTYIHEYWDDILVFKWRVPVIYQGGDIVEFMEKNQSTRIPNFDGIDEYHRRTFILDL